jgi:hypothetical protein
MNFLDMPGQRGGLLCAGFAALKSCIVRTRCFFRLEWGKYNPSPFLKFCDTVHLRKATFGDV